MPQADEQLVVNVLMIPSARPGEPIPEIAVQPEATAIPMPIEFTEEAISEV